MKPRVEYARVPLAQLHLDPANARKHGQRNLDVIRASLTTFNQVEPLVVQKATGKIIGGNGRYVALREMGETEADVALVDCDDATATALGIALNRSAELAEWDTDVLGKLLTDLDAAGWAIPEVPGFTQDELAEILPREAEPLVVEDEIPDPPAEPTTQPGDVWTFPTGHRVVCGDALDPRTYDALLEGRRPALAFTDPPYNTGMKKRETRPGARVRLAHMFDDDFTDEEWAHLLDGFTARLAEHLAPDCAAYVFLDWRRSHELVPRLKKHFRFSNLIVWDKVVHGLGSDYQYTHEFLHVCKRGAPTIDSHQGEGELQDVWHVQRKMGADEDHATKKPVELPARAMRHASRRGDAILDPFLGSGSTLIAAEQLGRACFGVELDPAYVDVAIRRYVSLTGKRPTNQKGEEWRAHGE